MMVKSLWLTGIAALALLGSHASDASSRNSLLREFLSDPGRAVPTIAEQYGQPAGRCASEQTDGLYPLAASFLTIETFATGRLASWARAGLVDATAAMGLTVDISVGPGRIRPSTARAAVAKTTSDEARHYADLSEAELAKALLRPCDALRLAVVVLDDIRQRSGEPHMDIDRKFVRHAAVIYNGQAAGRDTLEASLAGEIYQDLVYETYQHYRFQALAKSAAVRTDLGR
jgi:hypothetical protein